MPLEKGQCLPVERAIKETVP